MLTVEYFPRVPALSFTGHAGSGPVGEDLVCAGASALFFTLIGYLDRLDEEFEPEVFKYGDRINITLDPPIYLRHDARLLLGAFAGGFEMLGEKYPENVKFVKDPPVTAEEEDLS